IGGRLGDVGLAIGVLIAGRMNLARGVIISGKGALPLDRLTIVPSPPTVPWTKRGSIDAASIGRPILGATKEGGTPGLVAMTWPLRWITLVRLIRVARLTNTAACGAGRTTTATAGAMMSEARTNTQTSGSS